MAFDDELAHFMAGVRQEESGGRYDIGPNAAGASGAYQFLDSTWGGYGGYAKAYQAPPEVQDARARQLMTAYYQRFGSWASVAQAWLGGPGSVGRTVRDNYTGVTSSQYVNNVLHYAGMAASGVLPAHGSSGPAAAPLPAPDGDRHDLGVQLSSFASLLANPLPELTQALSATTGQPQADQPVQTATSDAGLPTAEAAPPNDPTRVDRAS